MTRRRVVADVRCPHCEMPFPRSRFRAPILSRSVHINRAHLGTQQVDIAEETRFRGTRLSTSDRIRRYNATKNDHLPTYDQLDAIMRRRKGA